ncbi:TPA: hypothetical protein ACPVZG_004157 [Vibrio parahaemolyticus]
MTLSIATIKSAAAGCENAIELLNEHYCYGHCMDLAIAQEVVGIYLAS